MIKNSGTLYNRSGMVRFFLKGSLFLFAASIVANLFSTFFNTLIPQIISFAIDCIIGSEPVSANLIPLVGAVGGIEHLKENIWIIAVIIITSAALIALFNYFQTYLTARANQTLLCRMRNTLFSHIQRLPLDWHNKHKTGDIIQRCTSDVDTISNFISNQLITLFKIIILTVFSLTMMFSMNALLALIAAAFVPVLLTYSLIFYKKAGKYFKQCDEQEGVLSTYAQENLSGVRVVRAFGRERHERDKFEKQNVYYTGLWVKIEKYLAVYWTTSDLFVSLQLMVIVVLGSYFCVRGLLSPGKFVGFISYNVMLMTPIRQLGRIISNLSKAGVSIDRLSDIMNSREEIYGDEDKLEGDIKFKNVGFSYGDKRVLDGIDFVIPEGSTLGIIGATGSGKSTLVSLLDRLYPTTEGEIFIGDRNIRDISPATLRANIGLVLQDGFLFSRSIGDNIGIASDGATIDEIENAAKTACIDENIRGFAFRYDTIVGERGVTLSGGQKQRVAIARTLLRKTPYLIFDDSLSAVDSETDVNIRSNLEKEFEHSTVIIISHRITTVMNADNIIVLDEGKIVEEGNHETLIEKGGIYKKIFDLQMTLPEGFKEEEHA